MNNLKWLQRKYPKSFKALDKYFNAKELEAFKNSTMKIGRLTKDNIYCQEYKKGSIIQFRRSNPVNDDHYPLVYIVIKCKAGYTQSGYHSFLITPEGFEEIKK